MLDSTLDVNWDGVVWVAHLIELTVHQGFIKVEHESLAASQMLRLRTQQSSVPLASTVSVLGQH